jgi:hypothetical protein
MLEAEPSLTHNRFVVQAWRNLRFDLHVLEAGLGEGKRRFYQ